jgi:hypothetical protein
VLEAGGLKHASAAFDSKFLAIDRILTRFMTSFPKSARASLRESTFPFDRVLADTVAVLNTVARASMMQLQSVSRFEESRSKMFNAAHEIVAIAEGLEKTHEIWWQVPMTVGRCACIYLECTNVCVIDGVG